MRWLECLTGGSNRCHTIFLQHTNAQSVSGVLTLATRMEMTATAILWRVGSSWLLSQLITIVAAKYLNHDHSVVVRNILKEHFYKLCAGKPRENLRLGLLCREELFLLVLTFEEKKYFSWISVCWKNTTVPKVRQLSWLPHDLGLICLFTTARKYTNLSNGTSWRM